MGVRVGELQTEDLANQTRIESATVDSNLANLNHLGVDGKHSQNDDMIRLSRGFRIDGFVLECA